MADNLPKSSVGYRISPLIYAPDGTKLTLPESMVFQTIGADALAWAELTAATYQDCQLVGFVMETTQVADKSVAVVKPLRPENGSD